VDVFVQGERVATIDRRGHLLGEMSIISSKPCSATTVAQGDVELLKIATQDFIKLASQESKHFEKSLYQHFARVLTEKLAATNEKARRFEETNIGLAKAQEDLKKINLKLEEKVKERTAELESQNVALATSLHKLEDLYRK